MGVGWLRVAVPVGWGSGLALGTVPELDCPSGVAVLVSCGSDAFAALMGLWMCKFIGGIFSSGLIPKIVRM